MDDEDLPFEEDPIVPDYLEPGEFLSKLRDDGHRTVSTSVLDGLSALSHDKKATQALDHLYRFAVMPPTRVDDLNAFECCAVFDKDGMPTACPGTWYGDITMEALPFTGNVEGRYF
jgi:hypothetical protein